VEEMIWNFNDANLPIRFKNVKLKDLDFEDNQRSIKKFRKYLIDLEIHLRESNNIMLVGPVGIGKTMLLTVLGKRILKTFDDYNTHLKGRVGHDNAKRKYKKLFFITASHLIELLTYFNLNKAEQEIKDNLQNFDALIIDDLTRYVRKDAILKFDYILRNRYHKNLWTGFSSQLPLNRLVNLLEQGLIDIIQDQLVLIKITGKSFRKMYGGVKIK